MLLQNKINLRKLFLRFLQQQSHSFRLFRAKPQSTPPLLPTAPLCSHSKPDLYCSANNSAYGILFLISNKSEPTYRPPRQRDKASYYYRVDLLRKTHDCNKHKRKAIPLLRTRKSVAVYHRNHAPHHRTLPVRRSAHAAPHHIRLKYCLGNHYTARKQIPRPFETDHHNLLFPVLSHILLL